MAPPPADSARWRPTGRVFKGALLEPVAHPTCSETWHLLLRSAGAGRFGFVGRAVVVLGFAVIGLGGSAVLGRKLLRSMPGRDGSRLAMSCGSAAVRLCTVAVLFDGVGQRLASGLGRPRHIRRCRAGTGSQLRTASTELLDPRLNLAKPLGRPPPSCRPPAITGLHRTIVQQVSAPALLASACERPAALRGMRTSTSGCA